MDKNSKALIIALAVAIMIMGCGDMGIGTPVGTLSLQYEVVHQGVPTRIDRGDSIVGIRFNNPNDVPVKVNRITLTKLGTAGNETIEVSMLDSNENVHTAMQTRSGDRHTFETDTLTIPPGSHLINFRVFVSEPCQTIGYSLQSDDDIVAIGQNGEEVQVTQGSNSVTAEPVQVFGDTIHFSLDNDPQPQTVQQGEGDVVAMEFTVTPQMWVESRYTFVFLDYIPWEVAQKVTDITLSVLDGGEWKTLLGPEEFDPGGCFTEGLDCYAEFFDSYSLLEACVDVRIRVEYTLSPTIPLSTELEFIVDPMTWGFYDLENNEVLLSGNMSGDILRSSIFTVVP